MTDAHRGNVVLNLPDKKRCYELMHEMRMLEHIAVHSLQVCRVAMWLTDHLPSLSPAPNRRLVQAAALLHDITKTRSFDTGENHARTGARYLEERQFPEVADVVRQHVRLDDDSDSASIGAATIVNYADKRVLHDKIVSLDERMQYILERYGETPARQERIRELWRITARLESRMFAPLSFHPANLPALLWGDGVGSDLEAYRLASPRLK
jgi:putative nucleotidyltransferase with HDIG domain